VRRFLIILAVLGVLLAAGGAYLLLKKTESKNELVLYGNVDVRQVDLGFRVFGRVDSMPWQEGDLVTPGVLVATIDKQPYTDAVREAKANILAVKANLLNAERIVKRRKNIVSEGAVAQEDYDNALASRDVFKANLKQAQAALGVALTDLANTEIYAPSKGTILTRIREPGTIVNIADPVYTVSVTSPVWIRAFVSEPQLGLIYPDMPAEVYTDTKDGRVYRGHIGFISPVAEFTPKTVETTQLRTDLVYRLRIICDNPDEGLSHQGLLQGMPVTVKLPLTVSKK
jgi:membrane fusion protein YbhG